MSRRFPFAISVDCTKLHDLVSDFDRRHSVEITEFQNLELVVGELQKKDPRQFGEFAFSTEGNWNKTVVDVLAAVKRAGKEKDMESMRRKIHKQLVLSLAHESGHWYMFHTDKRTLLNSGRILEKVLRIFFGSLAGVMVVIAGVVIFENFSVMHFSSLVGADVLEGVFGILLASSFYSGLQLAQTMAKDLTYILSKSERFARKFEKWAKKDTRWNEVVSVKWNERPL